MFACFYIPDFSVQASLLSEPPETRMALNRLPIAILDGPANLPRVFASNLAARRAGIQLSVTKLQAEICAGIELRKRSLDEEESAQSALLDCADKFSPRVESTAPGAAILDLAGTEKLFGRQKGYQPYLYPDIGRQNSLWQSAARAMTAKAAEAGFDARIAIAANPDTAFLAARGFPENTVIPAGEEARRLAPLPIKALPASPEMLETLNSWGIRTFQSLAALPAVALVERLGQEGLYIQKLARGAITRPLLTVEPNAEFAASFEFDDPVETLGSIFFVLNRLLQELCSRLLSSAQAASELRLTARLNVRQIENGKSKDSRMDFRSVLARLETSPQGLKPPSITTPNSTAEAVPYPKPIYGTSCSNGGKEDEQSEHTWKLPVPTQDKNLLFNLLRLHLEQTSFSAPVRQLRLEVVPVKPRLTQGNLFAPPSPEPEKLEITLERIRGIVGATDAEGIACVGSPRLLNTHKPGSFTLQRFSSIQDANSPPSHPERSRLICEANRPADRGSHRAQNQGPQHARFSRAGVIGRDGVEESKDPYFLPKFPCTLSSSSQFANAYISQKSAPVIALRIFRPVLETTVELDGKKPHFVRLWNGQRRVLAASGPWSTSGNWWNAAAWRREEWDIAIQTPAGLGFYRIYRDRLRRQWFVEGVFD